MTIVTRTTTTTTIAIVATPVAAGRGHVVGHAVDVVAEHMIGHRHDAHRDMDMMGSITIVSMVIMNDTRMNAICRVVMLIEGSRRDNVSA